MNRRRIFVGIGIVVIIVCLIFVSLSVLSMTTSPANLWACEVTQIDRLHTLGFDGSGVVIGIVDSGLDLSHPDFQISSFLAWNDTISGEPWYYDDCDQGTHIVGILVGSGSLQGVLTRVDVEGIVPGVQLVVVKALLWDDCVYGGGNDSAIAAGIQFCLDQDVDIICLSLGKKPEKILMENRSLTQAACIQAIEQGVFVVVPVGNDGQHDDGDVGFPSQIDQILSVGAIGKSSTTAVFSSKGHQYPAQVNPNKKPELVAPGVDILSTRVGGAYGSMSGTSQSTAYVTGILALLLDAYPEYRHNQSKNQGAETITLFKDVLAKTAKKIGSLQGRTELYSHDDVYGYGLIQAYDAYELLGTYY